MSSVTDSPQTRQNEKSLAYWRAIDAVTARKQPISLKDLVARVAQWIEHKYGRIVSASAVERWILDTVGSNCFGLTRQGLRGMYVFDPTRQAKAFLGDSFSFPALDWDPIICKDSPEGMRFAVIGPTGSGKTGAVMGMMSRFMSFIPASRIKILRK